VIIQIGGMALSLGLAVFFLYQHKKDILIVRLNINSAAILQASLPFALNIFFMTALFRADGFMLERLVNNGAYHAGVYASAFRLTDAVNMMGFLVAGFLLPFISRNRENKAASRLVLRICLYFLLVPAIVMATGGWFLADEINNLLYHGRAPEASVVIRVLLICLPALALIQVHGTHLTATGHIKTFLRVSAFFALLNISLNMFIIPAYGAEGAAWTAVASQSAFALAVAYLASRRTGIRFPATDLLFYIALFAVSVLIFKWLIL
jgi:O-antigen/teichoic acid export membrane protein